MAGSSSLTSLGAAGLPVLNETVRRLMERYGQPFRGMHGVLTGLHLLEDLVPMLDAAQLLGLDPTKCILAYKPDYGYPDQESILQILEGDGYTICTVDEVADAVAGLADVERVFAWEDGGFWFPKVITGEASFDGELVGVIEQTTRGITEITSAFCRVHGEEADTSDLEIPVLSFAGSDLKTHLEGPAIATTGIQAIQSLTGVIGPGTKIGLLGAGTIGLSTAVDLQQLGARVSVWDADASRRVQARLGGLRVADSAPAAVADAQLVIGCSGKQSVTPEVIAAMPHGCYLASLSSGTVEIDLATLESITLDKQLLPKMPGQHGAAGTTHHFAGYGRVPKAIHLVANGRPANFYHQDNLPRPFCDFIVASMLGLATALAAHGSAHAESEDRFDNGIKNGVVDGILTQLGIVDALERHAFPS